MKKEPLALYILRYVIMAGIFVMIIMFYWSSVITEEGLQEVRTDIKELRREISYLQSHPENKSNEPPTQEKPQQYGYRPHIDPKLPNLLKNDPFYEATLPRMLGRNFTPTGTLHQATIGKPDNLHPFNNWSHIASWVGLCTGSAASSLFGIYETLAPDLAIKMEERPRKDTGASEFWVHLRDGVYWIPLKPTFFPPDFTLASHFLKRHQVTSADFKFYFDAVMNPFVSQAGAIAMRTYLDDIESIEIIDPLTFVVRWKVHTVKNAKGKEEPRIKYVAKLLTGGLRPLPSFVYQYFSDGTKILSDDSNPNIYRTSSVWAQNFSQHWSQNVIISCGPWQFGGMTERVISLLRNPNYFRSDAALVAEQEFSFKEAPENEWEDFQADKLDLYTVQPNQLIELDAFLQSSTYKQQASANNAVHRIDYMGRSYTYIGWNQARVYFANKNIRKAMTLAIDRKRIIREYLNGLGVAISGPFLPSSPNYDSSIEPWPYDPDSAKRLLAAEGWWDSTGDGIIDKEIDGKRVPFRFAITYFVKNATAKGICEYVSTALKELGIVCDLHGVDIADLSSAFDDKDFDALLLGWDLGAPPDDPRQIWYSSGSKQKGSSNAVGFSNAAADKIIDALDYENDSKKRIELYHKFHAILHNEQPYTFLYVPKEILLYRQRVQDVFIPADRKDLIPGANVTEPDSSVFWLKQ